MHSLRVGVVGTGVLGRYHARIYAQMPGIRLAGVYDAVPAAAARVAAEFGTVPCGSLAALAEAVDAVSVAVPASLHHKVVMELLGRGIHVLVEKPLAAASAQAAELVGAARERNLVLAVGHIERFNPAMRLLDGLPAPPEYIQAHRMMPAPPDRPGQGRRGCDVGVVLDLMVHDLDLALWLIPHPVASADAVACPLLGEREDFAAAQVRFANGSLVHLTASRVHPEARRTWLVHAGTRQYHLDFVRGTGTVAEAGPAGVSPVEQPIPACNALEEEIRDFCRCVSPALLGQPPGTPRVPGAEGLRAVLLAERVLAAAARRGTLPGGP